MFQLSLFGMEPIKDNILLEGKAFNSHLHCGAGDNSEAGCKNWD